MTNTIICTVCGGAGHVSGDCKFRKNPDGTYAELNPDGSLMLPGTNRVEQQKLDCEVGVHKLRIHEGISKYVVYILVPIVN